MIVLNNSTFKLREVENERLAVLITRSDRPIDTGENIKFYCMNASTSNLPIKGICSEY